MRLFLSGIVLLTVFQTASYAGESLGGVASKGVDHDVISDSSSAGCENLSDIGAAELFIGTHLNPNSALNDFSCEALGYRTRLHGLESEGRNFLKVTAPPSSSFSTLWIDVGHGDWRSLD